MKKLLLACLIALLECTVSVQLNATLPSSYKKRVDLIRVDLKHALENVGSKITQFKPGYSIAAIERAKEVINAEPIATLAVTTKEKLTTILDEMSSALDGLKTTKDKGNEATFTENAKAFQVRIRELIDDLKVGFFDTTTTQDLKKAVRTAAETYQKALVKLAGK